MMPLERKYKHFFAKFFIAQYTTLSPLDLNHGPLEPKVSVLPMSYADPFI